MCVPELLIGGRVIALALGDITTIAADAIVNAANSALAGGGGVDGAIHRAGGPAIMRDLRERYGARGCPAGSAVWTIAGHLPARWVIHAVGPIWHGGDRGEAEQLAAAYRAALGIAAELGARTVTLPAISTGIYGYPLAAGARIALTAARDALSAGTSVERVTFVLYTVAARDAFAAALSEVGGSRSG